ncbi:MAG: hypothetical protein ACYC1D_18535 [Acidimicrobiales bacterium]
MSDFHYLFGLTEGAGLCLADPPRFDDVVRVVRRHLWGAGLIDT